MYIPYFVRFYAVNICIDGYVKRTNSHCFAEYAGVLYLYYYLSYILQKYFYNDYKVLLMKDELILKNNLKQVRTEKKLSQSALAEMVGVSRNTISSIETGQFNPTAKLALILCIALDKKFEELFYF